MGIEELEEVPPWPKKKKEGKVSPKNGSLNGLNRKFPPKAERNVASGVKKGGRRRPRKEFIRKILLKKKLGP